MGNEGPSILFGFLDHLAYVFVISEFNAYPLSQIKFWRILGLVFDKAVVFVAMVREETAMLARTDNH